MRKITLSEYNAIPEDYRGIWTVERWDLPDWAEIREKHIGKRTMMVYDNGTCLLVEGMGFEIVDDSTWKKPGEVRLEIGGLYLKFYSETMPIPAPYEPSCSERGLRYPLA